MKKNEQLIGYRFPDSYKKLISSYDQFRSIENHFNFTNIYSKKDERNISFFRAQNLTIRQIMEFQDYDIYGYKDMWRLESVPMAITYVLIIAMTQKLVSRMSFWCITMTM